MGFLNKVRKERNTVKPPVRVSFKKQGSIALNETTAKLLGIVEGDASYGSLTVFVGTEQDGADFNGRIFIATGVPGYKVRGGKASLKELTKEIQKFFIDAPEPLGSAAKIAKIAKFETSSEVIEFNGAKMLELVNPTFVKPSEESDEDDE